MLEHSMPTDSPIVLSLKRILDSAPMSRRHWFIWWIAAIGILVDGYSMFATAVTIPLLKRHFNFSDAEVGFAGASLVIGTLLSAAVAGRISDRYGRRRLFIFVMAISTVTFVVQALAWNAFVYFACQLVLGAGIGLAYPVCASYVSEFMPTAIRGRMILAAFAFQAVGGMMASTVTANAIRIVESDQAFRIAIAFGALPALIALIFSFRIPESARWLLAQNKVAEARKVIAQFVPAGTVMPELPPQTTAPLPIAAPSTMQVLRRMSSPALRRDSLLAMIPWFMCDAVHFGIVIFAPSLIASALESRGLPELQDDVRAAQANLVLTSLLLVGFIVNYFLIDRLGRMVLQFGGFLGMAAVLCVLGWLANFAHARPNELMPIVLMLLSFIAFNFCLNIGPNSTTFILPAELFPTEIRSSAHGIATSFGRMGAASCVLLMPAIQDAYGSGVMLWSLVPLALIGAGVTRLFWHETRGVNLEDMKG